MSPHNRLSFEFFPPKTPSGDEVLALNCQKLSQFSPHFYSVTFGAGGSTQAKTAETVYSLRQGSTRNVIPHISCMGLNKETLEKLIVEYQQQGIKEMVVLRGDHPSGAPTSGDFRYANQLVSYIRQLTGNYFQLHVAAYPEFHPEAPNARQDLDNFKRKVEAGANSAITQYFYNPDAYFYFVDSCLKNKISIPIIPGIMPITNFEGLIRFSKRCGAEIPLWIYKRLEAYTDERSLKDFGIEITTRLCNTLLQNGAPGLHFYTLNKADPTTAICQNLFTSIFK